VNSNYENEMVRWNRKVFAEVGGEKVMAGVVKLKALKYDAGKYDVGVGEMKLVKLNHTTLSERSIPCLICTTSVF
jgi:hypothetical protein